MSNGQFHLDPDRYMETVRAEVPAYGVLQEVVAAATLPVPANLILDLGVGTGETARRVLDRHPQARLVAVDASAEMAAAASRNLRGADIRVSRLEDPLPHGPFDLVVSALSIHHLTSEAKADLFARVAQRLRVGGRFVLGDVVVPENPRDAEIPLEPGVDLPDLLADQLAWLHDAGLRPSVEWTLKDLAVVVADRN